MKFSELNLPAITDDEFDAIRAFKPKAFDICPTCDGRAEKIEGAGVKQWQSPGYWLDEEHHECDCRAQIALFTRYLLANIGTQYMRLDWNDFQGTQEAIDQVALYTQNWKDYLAHGFGLTFASTYQGVGKTFAATHIGKALVKARQRVFFLDFIEMVDRLCSDDPVTIKRMRESTYLILDDVRMGISERQNDLYALKFESVVRHRTNYDLPTIFTTNLTEDAFEENFPRIHSLIAPKQLWVDMNGADHRKRSETASKTASMIARGEKRPIT